MDEFLSPSLGKITIDQIAKEIVGYIEKEPDCNYQLIVGTDSEGNGKIEVVTAIVIYRQGSGGRYFYRKFTKDKIMHLKQKIYAEVNSSLQTSQILIENLQKYLNIDKIKGVLEIHIDIGKNGPTKEYIKEVTGMVLGCGLKPKIKPDSYGASMVADRHL
ncbi:MAG: ribonuclease H-like YkuK family protein [Candidatus Berkelbacteria bacterium]|nr:ribonuclease H-like YkuK family protein [Candidatus Berkelbacteria bacterium]